MLGLSTSTSSESLWTRSTRTMRKYFRKCNKAIMRSHRVQVPKYDMPIRLRPWFLLFTMLIMLLLAFLGFTNFSHGLPLNDKLLHFFCLSVATGVFYFIFDVEEDARRIWFWRSAPVIFTGITCFFLGGIVSEFVQSMLPSKEFQIGDIAANLLGSSLGLYIAYYLERYYRHRREISRLYQPLNDDIGLSEDDDEMEGGSAQLLPTHYQNSSSRNTTKDARVTGSSTSKSGAGQIRLENVWDEGEELFGIGDDSDDDEGSIHSHAPTPNPDTPKIVVTDADS